MKLLIVDDELSMRELLEIVFKDEGYEVFTADSLEEATATLAVEPVDIIISDLKLSDGSGMTLLSHVRKHLPEAIFVLITAYASADSAIDALKYGAYDYITKPFDIEEIKRIVHNASEKLAQTSADRPADIRVPDSSRIIGVSPAMIKIYKTIGTIAQTDSTILLTGESGTGKEMIARVIHDSGPRSQYPFVSVNCGAFPETLLESELFGYQKGAFTGAVGNKRGLFEVAHHGTLFLDEIAETTPAMQVKLLRAIQEKRIRRLGSTEEIPVDCRIIAATNKDLPELIDQGAFREDLYYRIAVIPIHLPPLRERKEDIPALAKYFLQRFNRKMGKNIQDFERQTMELFVRHDWRGNVRELENLIERAVALETAEKINVDHLPMEFFSSGENSNRADAVSIPQIETDGLDLDHYLEDVERKFILKALEMTGGVQVEAARLLHLSYRSLRHRMQKLDISS